MEIDSLFKSEKSETASTAQERQIRPRLPTIQEELISPSFHEEENNVLDMDYITREIKEPLMNFIIIKKRWYSELPIRTKALFTLSLIGLFCGLFFVSTYQHLYFQIYLFGVIGSLLLFGIFLGIILMLDLIHSLITTNGLISLLPSKLKNFLLKWSLFEALVELIFIGKMRKNIIGIVKSFAETKTPEETKEKLKQALSPDFAEFFFTKGLVNRFSDKAQKYIVGDSTRKDFSYKKMQSMRMLNPNQSRNQSSKLFAILENSVASDSGVSSRHKSQKSSNLKLQQCQSFSPRGFLDQSPQKIVTSSFKKYPKDELALIPSLSTSNQQPKMHQVITFGNLCDPDHDFFNAEKKVFMANIPKFRTKLIGCSENFQNEFDFTVFAAGDDVIISTRLIASSKDKCPRFKLLEDIEDYKSDCNDSFIDSCLSNFESESPAYDHVALQDAIAEREKQGNNGLKFKLLIKAMQDPKVLIEELMRTPFRQYFKKVSYRKLQTLIGMLFVVFIIQLRYSPAMRDLVKKAGIFVAFASTITGIVFSGGIILTKYTLQQIGDDELDGSIHDERENMSQLVIKED